MGSKKYSWPKEDKYVEDCLLIDLNFPKVSLSLSLSLSLPVFLQYNFLFDKLSTFTFCLFTCICF